MKKFGLLSGILVFLALTVGVLWGSQRTVEASPLSLQNDSIPRGAALYDNWYAALEVDPPAGNMPLWSRQQTNTSSGPDTWRCVTCHGWDYQGKDGAYGSGSHYTGFPGIYTAAQTMTADEIIAHLKGENDPAHDYSALLDEANLRDLATFIKQGLVDDNQYIDLQTLAVKQGDAAHAELFMTSNAQFHAAMAYNRVPVRSITLTWAPGNPGSLALLAQDPFGTLARRW